MILTAVVAAAVAIIGCAMAWCCRYWGRRRWPHLSWLAVGVFAAVTLPAGGLAIYLAGCLLVGQPPATERPLGVGVVYRRYVFTTPGLAVAHVVEIANSQHQRLVVTPPVQTPDGPRNAAGYAAPALDNLAADVVVNANFFTPFYDNYVFDAYPGPGDWIEPLGPVIADGIVYGRPKQDWPSFWQKADGTLGFGPPVDAVAAVTGRQWLARDGRTTVTKDEPPYPRTAVAMDRTRQRLWLIVVDGKQPRYSNGITLGDLAAFAITLGASDAIELDGGGSSILAVRDGPASSRILSRPCHTKIPGRQRPTGVFLGVQFSNRP